MLGLGHGLWGRCSLLELGVLDHVVVLLDTPIEDDVGSLGRATANVQDEGDGCSDNQSVRHHVEQGRLLT